jgi:hypothetical protein
MCGAGTSGRPVDASECRCWGTWGSTLTHPGSGRVRVDRRGSSRPDRTNRILDEVRLRDRYRIGRIAAESADRGKRRPPWIKPLDRSETLSSSGRVMDIHLSFSGLPGRASSSFEDCRPEAARCRPLAARAAVGTRFLRRPSPLRSHTVASEGAGHAYPPNDRRRDGHHLRVVVPSSDRPVRDRGVPPGSDSLGLPDGGRPGHSLRAGSGAPEFCRSTHQRRSLDGHCERCADGEVLGQDSASPVEDGGAGALRRPR